MYSINNPCNIRYSSKTEWRGQIGSRHGFCYFTEMLYGYRAFLLLCRTYHRKYNIATVQAFVQKYAPPSENNTPSYIGFVVSGLAKHGIDSKFNLERERLYWLAYYVSQYENGYITDKVVSSLDLAFSIYYKYISK